MSETIQTQLFTSELFDLFDETFSQVQGMYLDKGTSLFETLATITADEASIPVGGQCATLAAQVEHIRFYLEVLERALLGQEVGRVDWSEIWQTVGGVTQEEWAASQQRLRETHDRVRGEMAQLASWDDDEAIAAALSMIVHTAYHLGEIRQALCVVKTRV